MEGSSWVSLKVTNKSSDECRKNWGDWDKVDEVIRFKSFPGRHFAGRSAFRQVINHISCILKGKTDGTDTKNWQIDWDTLGCANKDLNFPVTLLISMQDNLKREQTYPCYFLFLVSGNHRIFYFISFSNCFAQDMVRSPLEKRLKKRRNFCVLPAPLPSWMTRTSSSPRTCLALASV